MDEQPVALGLMVCEKVIVEERTHNVSLINCFISMKVETLPSEPRRFDVFAALTNGFGDVNLEVVIERLDTWEPVYRRVQSVRFVDRLQEVRFILRISNVSFPVAGAYQVTLSADGDLLAQHEMRIITEETE